MTAADADKLLSELPAQIQSTISRNPDQFLQQLVMFEEMAKRAEQEGLDKKNPYRQELDPRAFADAGSGGNRQAPQRCESHSRRRAEILRREQGQVKEAVKARVVLMSLDPGHAAAARWCREATHAAASHRWRDPDGSGSEDEGRRFAKTDRCQGRTSGSWRRRIRR